MPFYSLLGLRNYERIIESRFHAIDELKRVSRLEDLHVVGIDPGHGYQYQVRVAFGPRCVRYSFSGGHQSDTNLVKK